jgi:hypothetical protein
LLEEYYTPTSDKQFIDNFPRLIKKYDTLHYLWWVLNKDYAHQNNTDPVTRIYSDFEPIVEYLDDKKYKQNTKKIIPLEALISNENIQNTVKEARQRIIDRDDFEGAITSARTLVEGILKELYRELKSEDPLESDLPGLYKLIVPLLNLDISEDLDKRLKKILSGLYSVDLLHKSHL